MIELSVVDIPCDSPCPSGKYSIGGNESTWHTLHNLPTPASILNTEFTQLRFLSEGKASSVTSLSLAEDLYLTINNALWTSRSFQLAFEGQNYFMLTFRLSGRCVETIDGQAHSLGRNTCTLFNLAQDIDYQFQLQAGEVCTEICITFEASLLQRKFCLAQDAVMAMLQAPACQRLSPWFNQCQMTPVMEKLAREILAMPFALPGYRLFCEAKTLELIALYITQRQLECDHQAISAAALPVVEIEKLNTLRCFLDENFREPPPLDALCKMSGLNRKKITQGFKRLFGKTIFEYIQFRRIETAKQLLLVQNPNMALIAEQVGYQYQSNFTKAFKQQLGYSPKSYCQSAYALGATAMDH